MTPPTTKGRLARARRLSSLSPDQAWDLIYRLHGTEPAMKWAWENIELAHAALWASQYAGCIAASLALDGTPATWPHTKGRRP